MENPTGVFKNSGRLQRQPSGCIRKANSCDYVPSTRVQQKQRLFLGRYVANAAHTNPLQENSFPRKVELAQISVSTFSWGDGLYQQISESQIFLLTKVFRGVVSRAMFENAQQLVTAQMQMSWPVNPALILRGFVLPAISHSTGNYVVAATNAVDTVT